MKIDSRILAKKIDKVHRTVLADIRKLETPLLCPAKQGFLRSTYQDDTGRALPCYELSGNALKALLRQYATRNDKAYDLLIYITKQEIKEEVN